MLLLIVDSMESVTLTFDYEWFQNLEDNKIFDSDPYEYYDNGITYNWFQTVMYNFMNKTWTFLAPLPFDNCGKCTELMPISSVTYINKSGKM